MSPIQGVFKDVKFKAKAREVVYKATGLSLDLEVGFSHECNSIFESEAIHTFAPLIRELEFTVDVFTDRRVISEAFRLLSQWSPCSMERFVIPLFVVPVIGCHLLWYLCHILLRLLPPQLIDEVFIEPWDTENYCQAKEEGYGCMSLSKLIVSAPGKPME